MQVKVAVPFVFAPELESCHTHSLKLLYLHHLVGQEVVQQLDGKVEAGLAGLELEVHLDEPVHQLMTHLRRNFILVGEVLSEFGRVLGRPDLIFQGTRLLQKPLALTPLRLLLLAATRLERLEVGLLDVPAPRLAHGARVHGGLQVHLFHYQRHGVAEVQ